MANLWFKFYGAEYLSDPKMDRLTVQERSCWLTLLCIASQSNGIIKFLSIEGLLNKSGIHFDPYDTTEWENAQNVLQTFEKYEMILIHKNGYIEIKNWEKRQEHNLTIAERVAKSRAKHKNVTTNVTNVTTEENRIEENRIYNSKQSLRVPKATKIKTRKPVQEIKEPSKQVLEVLTYFSDYVDLKNKTYINNKSERNAIEFLVSNYGLEKVLEIIKDILPITNKKPRYEFPFISKPTQLKEHWSRVKDGAVTENESKNYKPVAIIK